MKPKIYLLLGDGGYVFSMGFYLWGRRLAAKGYEVEVHADSGRKVSEVADDIMRQGARPIVLAGYSLGGNGTAWIAKEVGLRKGKIAFIVAVDPTTHGDPLSQYPLGPHVKEALCVRNTGWGLWSPISWLFGRSELVGPQVDMFDVSADHLAMQFLSSWQELSEVIIDNIETGGRGG
jgi:hypothetical protein